MNGQIDQRWIISMVLYYALAWLSTWIGLVSGDRTFFVIGAFHLLISVFCGVFCWTGIRFFRDRKS